MSNIILNLQSSTGVPVSPSYLPSLADLLSSKISNIQPDVYKYSPWTQRAKPWPNSAIFTSHYLRLSAPMEIWSQSPNWILSPGYLHPRIYEYYVSTNFVAGRLVRVVLVAVVCDKPAAHKIGGFASHSHTKFCTACWITIQDKDKPRAFENGGMLIALSN